MDKYYKPNDQLQDYTILKLLAKGRYGIVYLAKSTSGKSCIIKQLKEEMLQETREKLFYEEDILKALDSPKLPKFLGKFNTPIGEGYILEYMEGKVFEDLLRRERYIFAKEEIYDIAFKLLDILEYLHKNNVVHRDIRLPNVIVQENKELVLIDFGLARYIDGKKYVAKQDYWFLGDFLIHLYYTSCFKATQEEEQPWYEELALNIQEKNLLKRLMGIEEPYENTIAIRNDLELLIKNS